MNVQPDHVHLLVWIPPKASVSEIMGFLKGKLALRLFERFPQMAASTGVVISGQEDTV